MGYQPSWFGVPCFFGVPVRTTDTKQTAELAKRGDSITYVYECNRLKEIHYPGHPENDVTYVYGTKTDTGVTNGYCAGRLKYLIDDSVARPSATATTWSRNIRTTTCHSL
ncbi:MAG: hypothetical protein BWY72_00959 [Bacteroidetes bacterium ADurb.Bin416]|nr:MAG: hypothetical protein BWY72_00959 [Bacteroidetes bacterium ADurb.Bin416]